MPSIRIDDSVWDWLKKHARPLEDTPNSVLRRLAGLDPSSSEERAGIKPIEERKIMETPKFRFSGEQLRKENSLPVHHCLYHKDGKFYEKLTDFPGALCDPRGYLQFDTETEFKNDPRLNIGRKVNVPRGISTHPKYQTFPSAKSSEVSRLLLIRKESMTMTPPTEIATLHPEATSGEEEKEKEGEVLVERFLSELRGAGVKVHPEGRGNHFLLEHGGGGVEVSLHGSVLGTKLGWWSVGVKFINKVEKSGRHWGMVFLTPDKRFWVDGRNFLRIAGDETEIGRHHVQLAELEKSPSSANRFSSVREFLLISGLR